MSDIDHPDTFNHIGCFMPRRNTEVWTIFKPDVTRAEDAFPAIRFRKGDLLAVHAGGCVQTGGSGATWKRYVRPLTLFGGGDSSYFGSLRIPSVVGETRLLSLATAPPIAITSDPGPDGFLRLHYKDDGYRDNGYWGPDYGVGEQCRFVKAGSLEQILTPAWVIVVIQRGCATVSDAGACPRFAPMDVVVTAHDANDLPFAPTWGFQQTVGVPPAAEPLCNFSQKTVGMPEDGVALCTQQATEKNNAPTKCAVDSPKAWESTDSTWGRIGGHVNWTAATYHGQLEWSDHSSDDDDYNFRLAVAGGAGYTRSNPTYLQLEFDSEEVVDHVGSRWWQSFHDAVDASEKGRALPLPGGTPGEMVGRPGARKEAVVVGLLGLDCAHSCGTELHPLYAMAIRTNSDPSRDVWAIFARNWGNEGYCGPEDRPLRRGDPSTGEVLDRLTLVLPPPAQGGPWKSAVVLSSSQFAQSHPGIGYSTAPVAEGIAVTFKLLPPDRRPLIDGELHLQWSQ